MKTFRKLIISPHVDDEVIGCGGVLDKDSFVYYCGIDEANLPADPGHRVPLDERMGELAAVAKYLGFAHEVNMTTKVNFFTEQELIGAFERTIQTVKPDIVFLPHPGYNQDHRTVFQAAQIALRPHDKNFFVKKVVVYEAIHDVLWSDRKLNPNYFVPIDIERKLHANNLHVSQVRGMRDPEVMRALARVRGAMSNVEYAEAFEVLRWVE